MHIVQLLEALKQYRFIIVLKSKQIGFTWGMNGANLHLATFAEGANILNLSKGEDEAAESLDYLRFMHDQLPAFLRLSYGKDQSSLITFPAMYSRIRALPSTEDSGVGFGGATRVWMDEFEYHRFDRKNYAEILPPILEGGQLVIGSTADKLKIDTKFKELYHAAKAGDNSFYPIFFPYDVLPNRTPEWYNSIDLAGWEKECRYPRNEKEALETLKTRMFFESAAIDYMYQNVKEPIKHELSDKFKGLVRIFQLPVVGQRYCLFTDPSDGKEDPHAIIVIEQISGEQVAESHGKTPADMCAVIHDALVRLYNDAFNSFELNARAGGIFSEKLKTLNTPKQCPFLNARDWTLDTSGKTGWYTTNPLKDKALWGLEEAVRLYQFKLRSKEGIDEFKMFMIPEGDVPQAPRGGHDDYVTASQYVWLLRTYAPLGVGEVKSYRYRRTW